MSPHDTPSPGNPLRIDDRVTVRLDSMAAGGDAVGRHEGLTVFVEYGAPGDLVEVVIAHAAATYARAAIERIIEPGPDRVEAPCPYFRDCGGCQWQHLDYAAQVRSKDRVLRDAFARIAGFEPEVVDPPVAMAHPLDVSQLTPWQYRAAAEYSVAPGGAGQPPALGFVRAHSREPVAIADCLVQHPLNVQVLRATNEWLAGHEPGGLWLVKTRTSFAEQRSLVTLVFRAPEEAARGLAQHLARAVASVAGVSAVAARDRQQQHRHLSQHLLGEEFIAEEVAGRRYRMSADTFFQTNPQQAARLVELVSGMAQVRPEDTVVDGYSGGGIFLIPLGEAARRAVGIESNPAAARDARANARHAGLGNVTVVREKVERALTPAGRVTDGSGRFSVRRAEAVVLDPPRNGCGRKVVNQVAALMPRAIVMVSCDPATLARDAAFLAEQGYRARRSVMVDMFPHTWRVESVTLFERG
jgi:23S rRNA (uracil1939-C5)-methyltransferase